MSQSDESDRTLVSVRAGEGTEISVLDHAFHLEARGLETLDIDLLPGIYKFKFKTGGVVKELLQLVERGAEDVVISAPQASFPTPAPLSRTSQSHEYQEAAAIRLSREVHERVGDGSELFVFARRWSPPEVASAPYRHDMSPVTGLSLRTPAGGLLIDFERAAKTSPRTAWEDPWAGCTVVLDPGIYRLRLETSEWGALEQTLVASSYWQTQVFLLQQESNQPVDTASASVLQTRLGEGFDPSASNVRLTDLARQALANDRQILSWRQVDELLSGKFQNPMLGLYGAHQLIRRAAPDLERLSIVVENLDRLLGPHPDVEALRLALEGDVKQRPFRDPPMLSASWRLIVESAVLNASLVPEGSESARTATRQWGAGAWLMWIAGNDAVEPLPAPHLAMALQFITSPYLAREDTVAPSRDLKDLSDMEEALLASLRRHATDARAGIGAPHVAIEELRLDIARDLSLPPATVNEIAASLYSKFA